jgi:uncharacterized protein DUF6542
MRRSGRSGPSGPLNEARSEQTGKTALGCSITAMAETVQRLGSAASIDLPQALAVISEAVWWVTIVDASMIRYHREAYDHALAALDPAARRAAEGTFAGLRFVRNEIGYRADPADFIQPQPGQGGAGDAPVAAWIWKPVPAPELEPVPRPGRGWEISRHQQYRTYLADHPVGQTIGRVAALLTQVHAAADRAAEGRGPPFAVSSHAEGSRHEEAKSMSRIHLLKERGKKEIDPGSQTPEYMASEIAGVLDRALQDSGSQVNALLARELEDSKPEDAAVAVIGADASQHLSERPGAYETIQQAAAHAPEDGMNGRISGLIAAVGGGSSWIKIRSARRGGVAVSERTGRLSMWGSLPGGLGVCIVISGTALGAIATIASGSEPGFLLGLFVVLGTVTAALAVRPCAGWMILPVPALSYLVAALGSGIVYELNSRLSMMSLAIAAAQWIASGFFAMTSATVLAAALTWARWCLQSGNRNDPRADI